MTVRPGDGDPAPDDHEPETAATREARGSVHEAIGKLIGDDTSREHGTAERRAGAAQSTAARKPPRSRP